jgi:hypothetical protein
MHRLSGRRVRLALLALGLVPAAAMAAMSGDEVIAEAGKLPRQVPGQYRMSMELLALDGPAEAKEIADSLRSDAGSEEVKNSDSCDDPAAADDSAGSQLVREILADDCVFEQFTVAGEAVTAVVTCPADSDGPGRVKMSGRIGADSLDMLMTVEQRLPDKNTMRMKMRIRSERIGECA